MAADFVDLLAWQEGVALVRDVVRVAPQLRGRGAEEVVDQLEAYMASTHTSPADFVAAWKGLEPYRVAVPVESDPLAAQFLFSTFKVALAILESRLNPRSAALSA